MDSIFDNNIITSILLQFRINNEQYIVFIPSYPQYTSIANSIDHGVEIIKNNIKKMRICSSNINGSNLEQNKDDILVCVNT